MNNQPQSDLSEALKVISSTIRNCEKMLPKFDAGSSQNTLLQNRLQAMYIAKALILEDRSRQYSKEDLVNALQPIASILRKCRAGQEKHAVESPTFVRFQKIIDAMTIAQTLIETEIKNKS